MAPSFPKNSGSAEVAAQAGARIRYRPEGWRHDEEGLEIAGITKLHDAKLAGAVYQMLEDSGLIYGRTDDGFSYTNDKAAYLIISFLA